MNGGNDKGLLPNPWSFLMVLLLAVGVIVERPPLESARPGDPERIKFVPISEEDVAARLWQDPLAAVEEHEKRKGSNTGESSPRHTPESVLTPFCKEGLHRVTVLAVSVFSGSYAAAAEVRRRWRFAVVSALGMKNYLPVNSNAIGYFRVDLEPPAKSSSLAVPYEWFWRDGDPQRYVLVIWLSEDRIAAKPDEYLQNVLKKLQPATGVGEQSKCLQLNMKLVGPSGSDMLANLIRDRAASEFRPAFKVFSQGATVPTSDLFAKANVGTFNLADLSIARATGTDEKLVETLLDELARRYIASDSKDGCADGLVLIREWDTQYSRRLSNYLKEDFADRCTSEFTYFRGLDGALPDLNEQQNGPGHNNGTDALPDIPTGLAGAFPEHAEGRSQYDYLRRMVNEIKRLDIDPKFAEDGVKAIGIIGSDVYDKLLILQALRPFFRDAVFFTTDLDARYLHADQNTWARNLVVASNFDLTLHAKLQGSTPPFRGAYQTATYLATLMALDEDKELAFWNEKLSTWLSPQIFEIGRRQAVHLFPGPSANEQAFGSGDCLLDWTHCAGIQPVRNSPSSRPLHIVLVIVAVGVLLFALLYSPLQEWIRSFSKDLVSPDEAGDRKARIKQLCIAATSVLVLGLALTWVWYSFASSIVNGEGEPFFWLEGISVWPSLLIRFSAVFVTVLLAIFFICKNRKLAAKISKDFFACDLPVSRKLDRPRWKAVFIGPHLDLARFDAGGNTIRQGSDASLNPARLWQNYLRATGWREMVGWVGVTGVLNLVLGSIAFTVLERPFFPGRGVLVQDLHYLSLVVTVIPLWVIIFWVGYETRACNAFILKLCERSGEGCGTESEHLRYCREAQSTNVPAACCIPYVLFRLIVEAAQRIQGLIYLPFILILFLIVARADFFDAMDFPLPLVFVIVLALAYALFTTFRLRRSAEDARTRILEHLEGMLLKPQTSKDGPSASPDQINLVMQRIRATREGIFAPFSHQPALQALLLPFGGYGSVQIIQYVLEKLNV